MLFRSPVRGRGLKRVMEGVPMGEYESPPVRGRGLKHREWEKVSPLDQVAPRAGAWIET